MTSGLPMLLVSLSLLTLVSLFLTISTFSLTVVGSLLPASFAGVERISGYVKSTLSLILRFSPSLAVGPSQSLEILREDSENQQNIVQ